MLAGSMLMIDFSNALSLVTGEDSGDSMGEGIGALAVADSAWDPEPQAAKDKQRAANTNETVFMGGFKVIRFSLESYHCRTMRE